VTKMEVDWICVLILGEGIDFMEAQHYWLISGIILMIAEIFTPAFLLASFGIGALGGSLSAYLDYEFPLQLTVFSIVTMTVFFWIRPVYTKFLYRSDDQIETGVKAFIGNTYKVTEAIINMENTGRVKVGSESWRARSEADAIIEAGELVVVSSVEGSTLIVSINERIGK